MAISKETKAEIIKKFGGNIKNTGKIEVQIALISAEIDNLTTHMIANKKDRHSKRGLYKKVSQRKSLLKYLEKNNIESYRKLLKELNLRG